MNGKIISPQQHRLCAYRNEKKSMVSPENPMGYDYCDFDEAYIPTGYACHAGDEIEDVTQLECSECGALLAEFKVVKSDLRSQMDKGKLEIVDFRYSDQLLSYRPRLDGLIGLECICGNTDTRLSDVEKKARPELFPGFVKGTKKNQARYGHKDSKIKYNVRKEKKKTK